MNKRPYEWMLEDIEEARELFSKLHVNGDWPEMWDSRGKEFLADFLTDKGWVLPG